MSDFIPLSPQDHAHQAWQPCTSYVHARDTTLVPLAFDELTRASAHFVLGFIKPGSDYQLVALLGAGFNAYVHPQDGRWLGAYVPAKLRGAPFELGHQQDDPNQPLLCIDRNALVNTSSPNSHSLFDPQGELAPKTAEVLNFLHKRLKGTLAAQVITRELNALPQLIEPWPLSLPSPQGTQTLKGFYRINEAALKDLSPEHLHILNRRQALGVAYAQLISTGHLNELSARCEHLASQGHTPELDLDQVFGEASNDAFKF